MVLPVYISKLSHISVNTTHNFDVVADLMKFKSTNKPTINLSKKNIKNPFINIHFVNNGVEMINLSRIIHLNKIKRSLPFRSNKDRDNNTPVISYTYFPPIRSKILNYKDTLKDLEITDDLIEDQLPPCDCASSPYKNQHHGHVITGYLNIIQNSRLRNLLSKGSNYRSIPQ